MESILTSIKKLIGITEEDEHFDDDIIMHINSVFFTLRQLGVGPSEGFSIQDKNAIWSDFLPDMRLYEAVKTYMYLKVKPLFDSNSMTSSTIASFEKQASEYEVRLRDEADPPLVKTDEEIQNGE